MPESARVILFAPKNIALVIQHVHVTQINFMLFNSQYEIGDDELAHELKLIRKFVANNYLYGDTFSPNFRSEIVNASKNVVLYDKNEEIILFLNYSINYNTNNLIVHLLVANISQALTFALGILIYEVLNNGLDGIVYHVRVNNSKMLNLSSKGGITEVPCTKQSHREFKCDIVFLINRYRKYYHRFTQNLSKYKYSELVYKDGVIYVNRDITRMHSIHSFTCNKQNYYYLSDWDLSIHGTEELMSHLYAETPNGISEEFLNYLNSNNIEEDNHNIERGVTCDYTPIDMFIFPTFACNLRCRYCYSEAAPDKNINLTFEKGQKGIDFLFDNAKKINSNQISISFHGGGEPTVNICLINKLVEYAERKATSTNIAVKFSISTNGTILNENVRAFLSKCESVQFSFDGTSEIQNIHRPFANDENSFDIVSSNIQTIHEDFPKIRIAIRSTISNLSVKKMVKFVKYFNSLGVNTIVFEPLIVTGRAKENKELLQTPNMIEFSEQFIASREVGKNLGVNVTCSASSLFRSCHFCGATNSNFILTPNGNISTCVEVSDLSDPLSRIFIIGNVSEDQIYIDKKRLYEVRQRGVNKQIECHYCIAEKSCRGNCPTRAIRNSEDTEHFLINELCIMQTRLFLHNLTQLHTKLEN